MGAKYPYFEQAADKKGWIVVSKGERLPLRKDMGFFRDPQTGNVYVRVPELKGEMVLIKEAAGKIEPNRKESVPIEFVAGKWQDKSQKIVYLPEVVLSKKTQTKVTHDVPKKEKPFFAKLAEGFGSLFRRKEESIFEQVFEEEAETPEVHAQKRKVFKKKK